MKLLSLFSGIGAFEKALDRLDIPYELVNYCEIDKYASKAYSLLHNVPESKNLGDITKVNASELPNDIDLITYGFPCQDISIAGRQKGFEDDEGNLTRSGLFFEALRLIEATKPKVAIAENVKNLVGSKFKKEFGIVISSLEQAGYNNYWKVLNSKNFGVPQNRERVFIVSIRKNVDDRSFEFPIGQPLELRLKDILEEDVDEKYYLDDAKAQIFFRSNPQLDVSKDNSDILVNQLGNCLPTKTRENPNQGRVYDIEGLSPSLNCMGGGNRQPMIPVVVGGIGEKDSNNGTQWKQQNRVYDNQISISVTTSYRPYYLDQKLKIRKLTAKECFRLMGFDDSDVDKLAEAKISNTQLYKMAGNSIVVNVVEQLLNNLKNILIGDEEMIEKIEEKKVVTFKTDKMINLVALQEKEPELFDELAQDYPCEDGKYIYEVHA